MKTTFSHELYKMAHQRSSWLAFILANPSIHQVSSLTNGELVAGNLIYTLLFLLIGLWAFKKRNF